jgi:hypothetical protein
MSNQWIDTVVSGKATCTECKRVFNLFNTDDADEWYFGHDCETEEEDPLPAVPFPVFTRMFHRMSGL